MTVAWGAACPSGLPRGVSWGGEGGEEGGGGGGGGSTEGALSRQAAVSEGSAPDPGLGWGAAAAGHSVLGEQEGKKPSDRPALMFLVSEFKRQTPSQGLGAPAWVCLVLGPRLGGEQGPWGDRGRRGRSQTLGLWGPGTVSSRAWGS